jgi:hypothetical protein
MLTGFYPRSVHAQQVSIYPDTVDPVVIEGAVSSYTVVSPHTEIVGNITIPCGSEMYNERGELVVESRSVLFDTADLGFVFPDAGLLADQYYRQQVGMTNSYALYRPASGDVIDCASPNISYTVRSWDGQQWYDYGNWLRGIQYIAPTCSRTNLYYCTVPRSYEVLVAGIPAIDDKIIEFTMCYSYYDTDPLRVDALGNLKYVDALQCHGYRWYVDDGSISLYGFGVAPPSGYYDPYTTLWYVDTAGVSSESWVYTCADAGVTCFDGTLTYPALPTSGTLDPGVSSTVPITNTGTALPSGIVDTAMSTIQSNVTRAISYVQSSVLAQIDIDTSALSMLAGWLYLFGVMLSTLSPILPMQNIALLITALLAFLVFQIGWGLYRLARSALI